jgi:hypothetical protein
MAAVIPVAVAQVVAANRVHRLPVVIPDVAVNRVHRSPVVVPDADANRALRSAATQ